MYGVSPRQLRQWHCGNLVYMAPSLSASTPEGEPVWVPGWWGRCW